MGSGHAASGGSRPLVVQIAFAVRPMISFGLVLIYDFGLGFDFYLVMSTYEYNGRSGDGTPLFRISSDRELGASMREFSRRRKRASFRAASAPMPLR